MRPRGDARHESRLFGDQSAPVMTSGINFDKYKDIPVKVTGEGLPPHIDSYDDAVFSEVIKTNLALCG
jgi:hypothetical protein